MHAYTFYETLKELQLLFANLGIYSPHTANATLAG